MHNLARERRLALQLRAASADVKSGEFELHADAEGATTPETLRQKDRFHEQPLKRIG